MYVAPTRRPYPPKHKIYDNDIKLCNDDEDCEEGSGSIPGNVFPGVSGISTEENIVAKQYSLSAVSSTTETETEVTTNTTLSSATVSPFTPRSNLTSSVPIGKCSQRSYHNSKKIILGKSFYNRIESYILRNILIDLHHFLTFS